MKVSTIHCLLAVAVLPNLAFAQQGQPAATVTDPTTEETPGQTPAAPELRNRRDPFEGVRTGGLGPEADLAVFDELAREGFHVYIDLRTDQEGLEAAREAAAAAGLDYISIPVGDDADLDLGTVRSLDTVLNDPKNGPTVVACASGNRAGALLALRAFWLERMPAEEALELGKNAGLSRSEPTVRTLLGLPPLPADEGDPVPAREE